MPLTEIACRNASCPEGKPRHRITDGLGLYLELLPAGGKYWRLKYRFAGKEKRLALGVYPTVTLAEARKKRGEARELLANGVDPSAARQEAKAAALLTSGTSFEAVARDWHERWKTERTDHHTAYVLRRLEADVFPAIGALPVADITASKLIAMARKIEDRGALDIAKRALQTCGQILRYAVSKDLIERAPSADVKPGETLKKRRKQNYARLDARELPELLRKIEVYHGAPRTRLALKLMALTFVRTSELIKATWDEFDLEAEEWRIPWQRMKMREPHIVPLSTQAMEVLQQLQELRGLSPMVFPGERDHDKPMSNNTILKALERMGYLHRMTGHGFRGIASTLLHENSFEHAHIEIQLAHGKRDAVSASYDHSTYLPQRRAMLQWWGDHLDALRKGAKVVPLRAA